MARFSDSTRGQYRHGYKASYTGPTSQAAMKAAKKAHTYFESAKAGRKYSEPEQLANGQWRVIVT